MMERGYIGPNPVAWVERLLDVNKESSFSTQQKALIDNSLYQLKIALIRTAKISEAPE